jgi:FkbM family methyltransferase
LIKDLPVEAFQDKNGNWYKAGGDNSTFYNPLEQCDPDRVFVNSDIVYNYNDVNPLNDYKVNGEEQNKTAASILGNIIPFNSNVVATSDVKFMSSPPVSVLTEEIKDRYRGFSKHHFLPKEHVEYLSEIKNSGFKPGVIYDIGACVLNWTNEAKSVWPRSKYIMFEAMATAAFLYQENTLEYHIGVLSSTIGDEVDFYQNDHDPAGNSYYQENSDINPQAAIFYNESHKRKLKTDTLDNIVKQRGFPLPDLIKMDIQGAELDVLKGAADTLLTTKQVILELQKVEYNKGAPLCDTVIAYMDSIGFDCLGEFSDNTFDGDYHFINRKYMNNFTPIPDRKSKLKLSVMNPQPAVVQPPVYTGGKKKKILIGIPNKNLIEAETFKSIYDLEVPDGYETVFQYFYGYQVEQVRNLIADWVVKGDYDYLFAVDADISFPPDTLKRLLSHDKDMVTGLYIQRIPGKHCIEVMKRNEFGGVTHIPWEELKGRGLVKVDSAGFGCVLIKKHVFADMEYPHFVYKSALDHMHTISEDVYFFLKSGALGKEIWADTTILCGHTGSWTFRVE